MTRGERWSVGALGLLLTVTAGWWALALWPAPSTTPEWLLRTREVCFGKTESGLPAADGWMLLVGQPLGMLALLLAGWRQTLASGMRRLWSRPLGRSVVGAVGAGLLVGLSAVVVRVAGATGEAGWARADTNRPATALSAGPTPTVDRPAPRGLLVDQRGDSVGMGAFAGRPVLVTFAFGHCETVCPVVVHRVAEARERLAGRADPAIVVVTLDPWRDTPSQLPSLHERWELPPDARVLGGDVETVQAALDRWEVARSRDRTTGDIIHPALVYVVDRSGTIRYATTGGADAVVRLVEEMEALPERTSPGAPFPGGE